MARTGATGILKVTTNETEIGMIERKKITLAAQPEFSACLCNQVNSTYNFTNMFIWSGGGITYDVAEGCLVLFFQGEKRPVSASFPMGNGDKKAAVRAVSDYIKNEGLNPVFRNLSEEMVKELEGLFPGCFAFVEDRNDADYIYETEKLIHLSGKSLHGKRNHFNYFKKTYSYEYKTLTSADMPACLALYDRWVLEKEDLRWSKGSREATQKLLENFDALPVRAGGIFMDGELVAFTVGEQVSTDTVLVHLEFAADYRGLFNVINSEFLKNEWAGIPFANREEDMGLDGLRQAKLAYRPVKLLQKFNAVQIQPL